MHWEICSASHYVLTASTSGCQHTYTAAASDWMQVLLNWQFSILQLLLLFFSWRMWYGRVPAGSTKEHILARFFRNWTQCAQYMASFPLKDSAREHSWHRRVVKNSICVPKCFHEFIKVTGESLAALGMSVNVPSCSNGTHRLKSTQQRNECNPCLGTVLGKSTSAVIVVIHFACWLEWPWIWPGNWIGGI